MPAAERQQETRTISRASPVVPHNWPDTGECLARKWADVGLVSLWRIICRHADTEGQVRHRWADTHTRWRWRPSTWTDQRAGPRTGDAITSRHREGNVRRLRAEDLQGDVGTGLTAHAPRGLLEPCAGTTRLHGVRREALRCIPGAAGRNSEGGSWIAW